MNFIFLRNRSTLSKVRTSEKNVIYRVSNAQPFKKCSR